MTTVEIQGLKLTSMNNIQFGFKIVQSFNNLRIKKKFPELNLLNITCDYKYMYRGTPSQKRLHHHCHSNVQFTLKG